MKGRTTERACKTHCKETCSSQRYYAATVSQDDSEEDCAIPRFKSNKGYDPPFTIPELQPIIDEFKAIFSTSPGKTSLVRHAIPTTHSQPVRIPPRRIPMHYRSEVEKQIKEMLQQGIIRESSSPWVSPPVYVRK